MLQSMLNNKKNKPWLNFESQTIVKKFILFQLNLSFFQISIIKTHQNINLQNYLYFIFILNLKNSFKMNKSDKEIIIKQKKPEVSIDGIKQAVKKYKNDGLESLSHFDLALALVTIGFKEVCKQFGAKWTEQNQQYALKVLEKSEYDLSWYGKSNSRSFAQLLPLTLRGDIQKIKNIASTVDTKNKQEILSFISTVDNFKRTALHLAVKQNFDVLAEFLINKGFSLNSRDRELKTPLHYCNSQLVCQILIQKGANVFVKDFKQCTPAHYATQLNDSKVLQILLKKSNIVNQCDTTLKSPIFYAIFNSSQEQINILRVLIENGAKLNEKDIQGRTPLHYAAQSGKSRCIPFLLQKGASINIRDKHNKTPLDLATNQKIKKILLAYTQSKGLVSETQEKQKRKQYSKIQQSNKNQTSHLNSSEKDKSSINAPIFTKQLNQVSTWVREKFFVLMKKLQESGVKANWHMKRPYIYTGSWAQDVESLEDLYETFLNVNGPQAAMRTFNLLCPFEKPLPKVIGKSDEAFQSFFGQNWFSNDPIQKIRNMHSHSKVKTELQIKIKQAQDLKTQLLGYRNQMEKLQTQLSELQSQLKRYQKIQDDLRKQRVKNTHQYSQILQLMGEKEQLKYQIQNLVGGEQKTKILLHQVQQLKTKNQDLLNQIQAIKAKQAASRRKCGQIFLKSLSQASAGQDSFKIEQDNLFDDDAIINLYDLLKQNPPNVQKRFQKADKKGKGKLTVQQFTTLLQELSMLPQDVMSMHRITGFAHGRKSLSMEEFKTILQNRHKNRPMWQKKLIKKIKTIMTESNLSLEKLFELIDKDSSGTIQANQLRIGLQNFNIFMNHTDWYSDKSGQIDLNELKTLLQQQKSGKLQNISGINSNSQINQQQEQLKQQQKEQKKEQEKKEQEEQKNQQDQKKSKVSYESRSQIANSILNEEEFKQPYEQKDSDQQNGIKTINGIFTIQVPKIRLKFKNKQKNQDQMTQIYLKFQQNDQDYVKLIDLTEQQLQVAVEFKKKKFKIQKNQDLDVCISAWKTRQFDEENYLGEIKISLADILSTPEEWKQSKHELQAVEYTKTIPKTQLILGIKWTPKTYEEMFQQSQNGDEKYNENQQEEQANQENQENQEQKNQDVDENQSNDNADEQQPAEDDENNEQEDQQN